MNVRKTAVLLEATPGRVWDQDEDIPMHKEIILAAIARSGKEGCRRLTNLKSAIWIRSPDLRKSPEQSTRDYLEYRWEDTRLAAQCPGQWVRALIVDHERTPALTATVFQDLLGLASERFQELVELGVIR